MPSDPGQVASIRSVAMAVPDRRVSNEEIAGSLGVDAEWIAKRTGTSLRPWARDGERMSDFAARAASDALDRCALDPRELDLVLVATSTADESAGGAGRRARRLRRPVGNSSTATLPIALSVAEAEGRLQAGDTVLLASFGGGFTWGPQWSAGSRTNAVAAANHGAWAD